MTDLGNPAANITRPAHSDLPDVAAIRQPLALEGSYPDGEWVCARCAGKIRTGDDNRAGLEHEAGCAFIAEVTRRYRDADTRYAHRLSLGFLREIQREMSAATEGKNMQPSVGRIVHYVSYGTPGGEFGKECRAAIITEVSGKFASVNGSLGPQVGLCVLNPSGQFFNSDVDHDPNGTPGEIPRTNLCEGRRFRGGTWHWPERTAEPTIEQFGNTQPT
jgi:hypothetical protein